MSTSTITDFWHEFASTTIETIGSNTGLIELIIGFFIVMMVVSGIVLSIKAFFRRGR